jgi:predicted phosphodiesterase
MIKYIGDIHGRIKDYRKLLTDRPSIQLGDFGFGFPGMRRVQNVILPDNAYFIRGNHDDPDVCRNHPNYLGDFGLKEIDGKSIYVVSGAWSIDWMMRTEGISWWRDEELSYAQMNACLEQYEKIKPEIVVSHDGPNQVTHNLVQGNLFSTPTGRLLTEMFNIWEPDYWIFGHYHINWNRKIGKTNFFVLNELGTLDF